MLQILREKAQGVVAWGIVIIISLTFALWGVHRYQSSGSEQAIIKVGKEIITQPMLNHAIQRADRELRAQLQGEFKQTPQLEQKVKQQVLKKMITDMALKQAAIDAGFSVTSQQVNATIASIPAFQIDGKFSQSRFQEIIGGLLYTPASFLEYISNTILIDQLRFGMLSSEFVLPNELSNAVALINQTRTFGYLIIPREKFSKEVKISQAQIEQYYQTHQQQFMAKERVKIAYIELSLPKLAKEQKYTEADLKNYYENSIDRFSTPAQYHVAHIVIPFEKNATKAQIDKAQQQAEKIYQDLEKGGDFAKLAKQYSADVLTKNKGGELPWFSATDVGSQFLQAVAKLQKSGDISQPVKTNKGFEIIKLIAKKDKHAKPFSEVKKQIEQQYSMQQAQTQFADMNNQLANLTFSNPSSLKAAAKQLNLAIHTSDFFTKRGGKTDMTKDPKVVQAAFSGNVLAGNNSNPITLNDNTMLVLRVEKHIPAKIKPLKEVENQIKALLSKQKQSELAKAQGQAIIKAMRMGKTGTEEAKEHNLTWTTADKTTRHNEKINSEILLKAFQAAKPSGKEKTTIEGVMLAKGDYAIIQIDKVNQGKWDKDKKELEQKILSSQLKSGLGQYAYDLYVKSVLAKTKIEVKDKDYQKLVDSII